MTDRDDALRQELGWTGPEETDYEPAPEPKPPPPPPPKPVPRRPPVDFVPAKPPESPEPPESSADEAREAPDEPQSFNTGPTQILSDHTPPRGTPEAPPPQDGTFRDQPSRYGPPQGPPQQANRDTRQMPPGAPRPDPRPDPGTWGQPHWQPRAPRPAAPPPSAPQQQPPGGPPTQPWPAPLAPPPSYADRIPVSDLVPARRTPPGRGWRLLVYKASFGLINPGPSPDEIRLAELENKIKGALRGHYKIGVMGKGGVGKTTVSASVGSVFAELRQDDRVVAIDADTAFGKLGSRVDPKAQSSYWELASDQHLETFADVRARVGNNSAGLFVLAGEASPARRRVLDPAIYREATSRLDRHFTISIVDCSSTMDSPVTQEVLKDLDALIVVSSPWVDGAAAAGQTLDWLANRGLTGLLRRTVIVLNDSDGHADKRTRSILAQQFAGHGQTVVEVPFDGHLRPGGVIDRTTEMSPATRRRFIEIAAALAEHFPAQDDRTRDRN
ncbi:MinD/ParA family ATP-binding protein [Mycobacterium hubeiense]|uniref:MinD/ParA family ATP-binding protein n=1 Tax=Mycobacterium hubeiense TaxID=1867256 RepID=UPI000C7F05B2|nr:MinD/ParA family protein [Mycobacterium sp. QGD 101]